MEKPANSSNDDDEDKGAEEAERRRLRDEEGDLERCIKQFLSYERSIRNHIKRVFKSFTDDDTKEVWATTSEEFSKSLHNGDFDPRGDCYGWAWKTAYCNAIDNLCQKKKHSNKKHIAEDSLVGRPVDPLDFPDVLVLIFAFFKRRLTEVEQLVLRTWIQLVLGGHATKSGRMPITTLVQAVNKLANPKMTPNEVKNALRTGRQKLRNFLIVRGDWDKRFWDLFDAKADDFDAKSPDVGDGETPDASDGGNSQ